MSRGPRESRRTTGQMTYRDTSTRQLSWQPQVLHYMRSSIAAAVVFVEMTVTDLDLLFLPLLRLPSPLLRANHISARIGRF